MPESPSKNAYETPLMTCVVNAIVDPLRVIPMRAPPRADAGTIAVRPFDPAAAAIVKVNDVPSNPSAPIGWG